MKAYIERPISEKPEKYGSYIVREIEELGSNLYAWFEDGYWHPAAGSIRCINNELECWLQPVEIPDPSLVVNTDVLVAALKEVQHHFDTWSDEPTRAIRLAGNVIDKALSQFTTPQPDKKEEKK